MLAFLAAEKDSKQSGHTAEDSGANNADVQALLHKLLDDLSTNQRVQEILQNPDKDDLCFLNVWDFGGQEAFAIVQRMLFANVRSAYAAVFDSALELEVRLEISIQPSSFLTCPKKTVFAGRGIILKRN